MFGTMELQIEYLLLLQQLRDATNGVFDIFFMSATWFGEVIIPLGFLAVIYWYFDKKAGIFILFNFALTLCLNVFLKMTACIKRPWLIDSRVCPIERALPAADGYSFPSGHTAGAMSVWGSAGYLWRKNRLVLGLMVLLVVLVAFSRNYIGVHTPQDVIVSIIIGLFIILFTDKTLKWIDKKPGNDLIFYTIIMIIGLILYLYLHLKCCAQMRTYNPLVDTINPLDMKHGVYGKLAFVYGSFTGWIMEKRFVNFKVLFKKSPKTLFSVILGLLLFYLVMFLADKFFAAIFIKRYASAATAFFIAFYISFIYPFIMKKIRR